MNTKPSWNKVEGSSNIEEFAYIAGDPETRLGTLYVRFASGTEYKYEKFPDQLAEDFFNANSKGKFFHANIRDDYAGERSISNELQAKLEGEAQAAVGEGMERETTPLPTEAELAEFPAGDALVSDAVLVGLEEDGKALRDPPADARKELLIDGGKTLRDPPAEAIEEDLRDELALGDEGPVT